MSYGSLDHWKVVDIAAYIGNVCNQNISPMVHWTISCMQYIKILTAKMVNLKAFFRNIGKLFEKMKVFKQQLLERQTDIVSYRGNVCNQRGAPGVHWIIGRLQAKNQGPKSRDKNAISF